MRVLMLESHPGVAGDAVAQLTAAGHAVVRCDTADRLYPCRGLMPGGECPLDEHVDVAVLVQEIGCHSLEHGAVCAARSRVPLIEVGAGGPTPPLPIATSAVPGADLLDECERAARDGCAHARAVADRLLDLGVITHGEIDGEDSTVAISVDRRHGGLCMTIGLAGSVRHREVSIVRAATQALRDYDRASRVIDVVVRRD
jgi:hypothetical protein